MNNQTQPPEPSALLKMLYNYRAIMAPHQRERMGGRLLLEAIEEIERSAAALQAERTANARLREDKARLDHLAAWCYREGGPGNYAPVYVVAHSDVWPIAGRELIAREKEAALRNAIDESMAAQLAAPLPAPAGEGEKT
jgi:hypothetical protein